MQPGCAALEAIIQVSDHPVDPSSGSVAATGCVGVLGQDGVLELVLASCCPASMAPETRMR